jgi:hypothetical protein
MVEARPLQLLARARFLVDWCVERYVSSAMAPSISELLTRSLRETGGCFYADSLPDVLEPLDSQVEEEGAARAYTLGDRACETVPVHGMRLAVFPVVDYEPPAEAADGRSSGASRINERAFISARV